MNEGPNNVKPERWRKVVGLEQWYEVSDLGRVRSLGSGRGRRTGRIVEGWKTPYGYHRVELQVANKNRSVFVHKLVAEAFFGKCPEGLEIDHIDTVKTNNAIGNLRYVTRSMNLLYRNDKLRASGLRTNGKQDGENNNRAKLTMEKVKEIRRLYSEEKRTQQDIADMFGVKREAIGKIIRGDRWK